jgi:hypothetical protein
MNKKRKKIPPKNIFKKSIYTVYSGGGMGSGCVESIYLPKQKPRREGGLRQINNCRQIPLQGNI